MLYLESSALVKRYIREVGTDTLNAKLTDEERNGQTLFSSTLTFAEVSYALWRKVKTREISKKDFDYARNSFLSEWVERTTGVELSAAVLTSLGEIYERTDLRSGDAIQLASAIWVRDLFQLSSRYGPIGSPVVFAVSDTKLAEAARIFGLEVFNPEKQQFP